MREGIGGKIKTLTVFVQNIAVLTKQIFTMLAKKLTVIVVYEIIILNENQTPQIQSPT